jgi:hypothetical protein
MVTLSRDEIVSIVLIGSTVAALSWYQSDMTGVQRWTTTAIGLFVSVAVATATFVVLKRWDPFWYTS